MGPGVSAAPAQRVVLPLSVRCPSCGRRWIQRELWAEAEVLACRCGAPAELVAGAMRRVRPRWPPVVREEAKQ